MRYSAEVGATRPTVRPSGSAPGEETGGIEARFDTTGERTTLHVESVAADGSPRDFYLTNARIVGPDLATKSADLVQIAPGVYEAPLGTLDPGAYAIRLTQTKPGAEPLGRTVGLVAPTSAEYRMLGTDESFLGSLRAATGGRSIASPLEVWTHDLSATNRFTDLWPLLLIIAVLLWPLDIGLRRVSVGRRELVGGAGLAPRWLAPARDRGADSGGDRDARRPGSRRFVGCAGRDAPAGPDRARGRSTPGRFAGADRHSRGATGAAEPAPGPRAGAPAQATPRPATRAEPPSPPPATTAGAEDTISRLREAKRRARER